MFVAVSSIEFLCSFTSCNLRASVLDSFSAQNSERRVVKQILKANLGPFLVHVGKNTESCGRIVKVSRVKSGEIVKTSIKQP